MPYKKIMSPASKALYPLRVQETLVAVGDMVTARQAALVAEGADGRRIALKCGLDGRVIQVAPPGAVLDRRQMILLVESFENAAVSSGEESFAAEPVAEAAPDPAQEPEPAPERATEAPRKTASVPPDPEPEPASAGSAAGAGANRRAVMAGVATFAAGGGLLGLAGLSGAFDSSGTPSSYETSDVAPPPPETPPAPSAPARDYPAPEDTAWLRGTALENAYGINYDADNCVEFLGAGIDVHGEAVLVGKGRGKGFATRHKLGSGGFHDYTDYDVSMDYGFALARWRGEDVAYFGLTPTDDKKSTIWRSYEPATGDYRRLSANLPDMRILHATRTRDFAAYLVRIIDGGETSVMLYHFPSRGITMHRLKLPGDDEDTFRYRSYHCLSIVQRDSRNVMITAGGKLGSILGPGGSGFFRMMPVMVDENGSSRSSWPNEFVLKIDDMVPEGVSDGHGSVTVRAIAVSPDGAAKLLGADIWGMARQMQGDKFRTDVAISIETADGTQYRRTLVRSDENWRDGVRLVEAVALPGRRFALLLREAEGKDFSAVVLIDETGETISRSWQAETYVNSISVGGDGRLYAAGYRNHNGRRYPNFRRFKA